MVNIARWVSLMGVCFLFASCNEPGNEAESAAKPALFGDFQVNAREGDDSITMLAQFQDWDALNIRPPRIDSIFLDQHAFVLRMSKVLGPYWDATMPMKDFSGSHVVRVQIKGGQQLVDSFDFAPLELGAEPPFMITAEGLDLPLPALDKKDRLQLVITDTNRHHEGINRPAVIRHGQLVVGREEINQLSKGPVQWLLAREYERAIEHPGFFSGRIYIGYDLERNWTLTDSSLNN